MATDRVGIEIDLMGYDEAMGQMRNLDSMLRGLKGRRNYVKIQAEVERLRMNRDALKAHKVKLQVDMTDLDKQLRKAKQRLNSLLNTRGNNIPFSKQWMATNNQIRETIALIRKLQGQKISLGDELKQTQSEINATTSALQRMQAAMRNMKSMSLPQMFNKMSSTVAHLGSSLQSMGYALNRLTAPMRMLTTGLAIGGAYSGISKITEGLSSGFDRYDIMKKYPKMMKAFGYSNEQAQKSIDALDQSVRGLPTGLDEIVDVAQRFTATTGDIDKGTKLAIAANNAFLASMSTDTQRYQGMMQLQDVLGGKDMNAREWNSLVSSMTPAIVKMGESMGYTNKNMDEWIQKVRDGKVANEDFIDTLIKVGNEGGEVAKMAEQSKDTWQAFSANVKNAFSRMMYGALKSMDEITQSAVGKDLNAFLSENVITGIDKATESVKKWIKAHPDDIKEFFGDLKAIDWKGLGKGFLDGFTMVAKGIQSAAKYLKGKDLQKLGKFLFDLNIAAQALTIGGGLIKGGRFLFAGLGTGLVGIARGLSAVGGVLAGGAVVKGLSNLKLVKNLKWLSWFAKTYKSISGISKAVGAAGTVAGTAGGGVAIGAALKPIMSVIGAVGLIATSITGIAAINTGLVKVSIDNLKSITSGISDVISNVNAIKADGIKKGALNNAVNAMTDIYNILYGGKKQRKTATANKAGLGQTMGEGKGFGDMSPRKLKKSANAMKNMFDMFKSIGDTLSMIPDLNKIIGQTVGTQTGRGITPFITLKNMLSGENGLFASFGAIAEDLTKYMGDGAKVSDASEQISSMKGILTTLNEFGKLVPQVQQSLFSIMRLGTTGRSSMDNMIATLTGDGGFFAKIRQVYDSMATYLLGGQGTTGAKGLTKGAGGGQTTQFGSSDFTKLAGVMESIKTMFADISGLITTLQEMSPNLASLTSWQGGQGSSMSTIASQLASMMSGIGQIVDAVNQATVNAEGIDAKTEGLVTAVQNIKSVVGKLNSLGEGGLSEGTGSAAFGAINSIRQMVTQLGNALNTETISTIQMQVAQFKASVDQIFATLNSDLSNVKVTVKINGKVTGHDRLISMINNARTNIFNAVRSIPSTINKSVSININPHVNVGSYNMPSLPGLNQHTGGLVPYKGNKPLYRSKGGGIGSIFKPKGVDTVPAMLQPGEYVMKKSAVDSFGVRFMQRLNNLDVRGAMRELSARAGATASMARSTTIYNNTVNNNSPTINQTVNTNNPNFAYKRSNRYVMAL